MSDLNVSLPSGASMPLIGLGTWQMRGRTCYEAVRHALEVGYRHIDTATMYGNQAEVGRALADSGVPRGDVFVTTKLPPRNVGRERQTIEASLRALGTDYVDLWLIHWPPGRRAGVGTWFSRGTARSGPAGSTTRCWSRSAPTTTSRPPRSSCAGTLTTASW